MPKPPIPPSELPITAPSEASRQRIKDLAKLPRGKAWASRLCAFEDAIRAQRKAHKSYREIAAWLDTQGLRVSASSVHGFVKARAKRKRPLYALPEPGTNPGATTGARQPPSSFQEASEEAALQPPVLKESAKGSSPAVFLPKPPRPKKLTDEDRAAMQKMGEP